MYIADLSKKMNESGRVSQPVNPEGDSVPSGALKVYQPNCLTKNLSEIDSLPHLRNLYEIFVKIRLRAGAKGGTDEVNDARTQSRHAGAVNLASRLARKLVEAVRGPTIEPGR